MVPIKFSLLAPFDVRLERTTHVRLEELLLSAINKGFNGRQINAFLLHLQQQLFKFSGVSFSVSRFQSHPVVAFSLLHKFIGKVVQPIVYRGL
jgi:hypothetical protein